MKSESKTYLINDCMLYPDMGADDAIELVLALQKLGYDVAFESDFTKISENNDSPVPDDIWREVLDEVRSRA